MRGELGIAPDEFVVLQLGRLVPRKGIDNVIRAVALLKKRYNIRARLVVVGGNSDQPSVAATPEMGRLMQIANYEGIADQVLFVGRRARDVLRDFYCAADVFVTTPWYEPFGITPVEAMACAVPVIGSNVGGIKYTVQHGKTGFLVPPQDPDALALRLAELQRNPELAHAMGMQGRRRAQQHFTWRTVAAQVAELYERVAPQRLPAAAQAVTAG
jgi:glycosyltransferase involved in cell wall biosynthesis